MNSVSAHPNLFQSLVSLVAPEDVREFWRMRFNGLWSTRSMRARVVARDAPADGAVSLWLKPNRRFPGFRAGQHVNVQVEVDGVLHTRSYSFASAPRSDGQLRIVVRSVDDGRVSRFLQTVPVGSIIWIGDAFGDLQIPQEGGRDTVILAAGSGITPMLAMIGEEAARDFTRPIHLLYWARTYDDMIDRDALRSLACENFKVTFIATSQHGRISEAQLHDALRRAPHVIACGSDGFVAAARESTRERCASFQAESFTPPHYVECDDSNGESLVTLQRSGKVIRVPRAQSLLEALEANGITPVHGCRMGICNTCSCGKLSGTARNVLNNTLHHEDSQSIRICVHAAQSDLILDL